MGSRWGQRQPHPLLLGHEVAVASEQESGGVGARGPGIHSSLPAGIPRDPEVAQLPTAWGAPRTLPFMADQPGLVEPFVLFLADHPPGGARCLLPPPAQVAAPRPRAVNLSGPASSALLCRRPVVSGIDLFPPSSSRSSSRPGLRHQLWSPEALRTRAWNFPKEFFLLRMVFLAPATEL